MRRKLEALISTPMRSVLNRIQRKYRDLAKLMRGAKLPIAMKQKVLKVAKDSEA